MNDKTIQYYENNSDKFIKSTIDLDMSSIYARFLEEIPSKGKILDGGCGSGRDSLAFSKMGYEVTAFDASKSMVDAARRNTDIEVECMKFQDITWSNEFDGIWCCASLLHVPYSGIKDVFDRLIRSLRSSGAWYMSFKYGIEATSKDQRIFTNFTESTLKTELDAFSDLEIKDIWISRDLRHDRQDEKWCNALVRKVHSS